MIHLKNKADCCGCLACVQKCPTKCIGVEVDSEGFSYPVTNKDACIDCSLCEKVCPVLVQGEKRMPTLVYAAKNKDENIRMDSSSGGVFTLLAKQILNDNGVVFGARFNERWEVIHDYTETIEGLSAFRGSKYVQSYIGETYLNVEKFLREGRKVLFSGTPCQVSGLKLFLRKEYENLFTVDFICHGVPSPGVFRKYLNEVIEKNISDKSISFDRNAVIRGIHFRHKKLGWKKFSLLLDIGVGTDCKKIGEPLDQNIYLRGFLSNLYLRPSCHECPDKCFKSGSDITIGDFWGVENILPEFDDDKGVSTVLILTHKGEGLYTRLLLDNVPVSYADVLKGNTSIECSPGIPQNRIVFFQKHDSAILHVLIPALSCPPVNPIKSVLVNVLRSMGLLSIVKSLLRK